MLFSDRHGAPVFSAYMSRLRFQFLLAHICHDDYKNRNAGWQHERFAAIRKLFDEETKTSCKSLILEDYLSLDETLYPMRNQISFKQHNPDKPAKYGLLFKSINAARYPYTQHRSIVYSGKPEGEPSEYYISGTINYINVLVSNLGQHHRLAG